MSCVLWNSKFCLFVLALMIDGMKLEMVELFHALFPEKSLLCLKAICHHGEDSITNEDNY